ncbi:MAG: hypothetical protein ACI9F9_000413 [Candidatus Paceibacteria bacterium]|jgi:hypothetical protein
MTDDRLAFRALRFLGLALFTFGLISGALAYGQKKQEKQKSGIEEFEEVCPYTKGDRDLERKLGYERVGFLPWRLNDDSTSVQENIGGIPMVWVETEHFRIGSSLVSYKLTGDKQETKYLKAEIERLKDKLGKLKAPKKSIDPWLRIHLYAQMLEDLYANFMSDFGFTDKDFPAPNKFLGHPKKFLVLLCEKDSEYGRYLRTYLDSDIEGSFRTGWMHEGMIATASYESVAKNWKDQADSPTDSMYRCVITACVTSTFIDGYRDNLFRAPRWLSFAAAHIYQKKVDPRWTRFDGRQIIYDANDDSWDWEPRVYKLVKNEFFASNEKLFQIIKYSDLTSLDHMIAWSKLSYLMDEKGGREGKLKAFLNDVCSPARGNSFPTKEEFLQMQTKAMKAHFGVTPVEFDEEWSKWVLKNYRKK